MIAFLNIGAPELLVIGITFVVLIGAPLAAVLLVLYFVVWRQKARSSAAAASQADARAGENEARK